MKLRKLSAWCLLGLVEASAVLAPGRAYAFVANANVSGWYAGNFVPSGEARFWKSIARTEAIVQAADKTIRAPATARIAANAGRIIMAGIRAAGPIGIAASVAAIIADRYDITWDDVTGAWAKKYKEITEQRVWCLDPGFTQCFPSKSAAAMEFVTQNSGANLSDPKHPYVWTVEILPDSPDCANGFMYQNLLNGAITSGPFCRSLYEKLGQVEETKTRPATQQDWDQAGTKADQDVQPQENEEEQAKTDDFLNNSPVPVPVEAPKVADQFVPDTSPYDCTLPGGEKRMCVDGFNIRSVDTTTHPTDMEVNPTTKVETVGGGGGTQPDNSDLCKLHPEILACQKLGDPPDAEVPRASKSLEWAPESVWLPASCPPPIDVAGFGQVSFSSACDVASSLAPFTRAAGALTALFIVMAALRRS